MEILILLLKFIFIVVGFFSPMLILTMVDDTSDLRDNIDKSIYAIKIILLIAGLWCILDTLYNFIWSL